MTREEHNEIKERLGKLDNKRSQLQNELSDLERQKADYYKDKVLTGNEDAKKLTVLTKRIDDITSELAALDDLILQAQSEIDPVAVQLFKIRKVASQLKDLRVNTQAWREYMDKFISPLYAELGAKVRLDDTLKLEILRDDFQNLDSQVQPIQAEINALESKLSELRSNPLLSAHKKLQNGLINLNQKMKDNDLYAQIASNLFNSCITEYTR